MKKPGAKEISSLLETSIAALSQAVAVAESELSTEEYEHVKRHLGISMGCLSETLDLVYEKYPDLAPPGLRDSYAPNKETQQLLAPHRLVSRKG